MISDIMKTFFWRRSLSGPSDSKTTPATSSFIIQHFKKDNSAPSNMKFSGAISVILLSCAVVTSNAQQDSEMSNKSRFLRKQAEEGRMLEKVSGEEVARHLVDEEADEADEADEAEDAGDADKDESEDEPGDESEDEPEDESEDEPEDESEDEVAEAEEEEEDKNAYGAGAEDEDEAEAEADAEDESEDEEPEDEPEEESEDEPEDEVEEAEEEEDKNAYGSWSNNHWETYKEQQKRDRNNNEGQQHATFWSSSAHYSRNVAAAAAMTIAGVFLANRLKVKCSSCKRTSRNISLLEDDTSNTAAYTLA